MNNVFNFVVCSITKNIRITDQPMCQYRKINKTNNFKECYANNLRLTLREKNVFKIHFFFMSLGDKVKLRKHFL